ncbi:integrase, catalytic region, zinc finger, CCHC-type containing protein [Tanacetum coccineum]
MVMVTAELKEFDLLKWDKQRAISSVRRPSNRDSSFNNSVLSNTKNSSEKVEVSDRSNKKSDVANVTNDDIKNALIAKNVLCVSCAKNVLIPCHNNCLAKYTLNVQSKVRRALFTTPRTVKYKFKDPTPIVSKTRFSDKAVQSKSLDTTPVVSKTKIDAVTPLSAKNKIVDSGCSKHMTDDRSLLKIFVEKFIGTVRFGNDHFAAITGYGDYVQGNITVFHVYYVEGLGHNLLSVEQFCDDDLEVAFRSKTCYVQNLEGDDLLTGDRESNLYTISISDMAASSPVCLMSKATSTKSWLWHRKLSHLNFGTINDLTKHDLVNGLLKFKYGKDHLCSACKRGNSQKASYPPKVVLSNHSKLELLHMDLCGPIRVSSVNGKRYNKTPYELLHGRKPNVEYFYMSGSLCYPTNNRDDFGKMKPKADIGIFIGYLETSRGFRIYNRRTKKIKETIHVKFDELTAMASEHEDLDNLFGPMYEEYFEKRSSEMSTNSVVQQVHNHEDSPSTSSIIVEEHEAPLILTTSDEQTSLISLNEANESNQEDSAEFDGNTVFIPYDVLNFEEIESSTIALDPSNMHEFHQVQPSTHI